MEEAKGIFQSKTIWGIVLIVAARICGVTIELPTVEMQEILNLTTLISEAIGASLAVYGRIVANKKIILEAPEPKKE